MPDILTRYPDTTYRILESGPAQCGSEQTARVLTECPRDQLCSFPDGEICVYDLEQIRGIPDMPTTMLRLRLPTRPHYSWYESPLIFIFLIPLLVGFVAGLWFSTENVSDD